MPNYEMVLHATVIWMDTGLNLDGTLPVEVQAAGQWTANPATGMVDANGHTDLIAKPGYSLPGHVEGLLVGKIGETVFPLGVKNTVPSNLTGEMYISINDDVNGQYGAGFPDNQGMLQITIKVGT